MILSHTREEVKQAVAQGELNKKALSHYDICQAKRAKKKIIDIAVEFDISERQVCRVIACKCPDLKES